MAQAALDDIRSSFAFFDAWEDRYRFILDLGRQLDGVPEAERVDANLVRGCQSLVWLVPRYDEAADRLCLAIDSDAHIVRGLIGVVLAAYDGRRPRDIVDFDIEALFAELDLIGHLSPARGNGLRAMVARIRDEAQRLLHE